MQFPLPVCFTETLSRNHRLLFASSSQGKDISGVDYMALKITVLPAIMRIVLI